MMDTKKIHLQEMNQKELFYQNAADIYTAMFTREDKDANSVKAIELAETLGKLLEDKYSG